jgi:hypothetical protein
MNRDDIAYSIPDWETSIDRYVMDESPLRLGELGAGLGLGNPHPDRCRDGVPRTECPYGDLCADNL